MAVSADGKTALSGSSDHTLKLWDVASARILASFTADASFSALAIEDDGKRVVAGDTLGRVHLLEVTLRTD